MTVTRVLYTNLITSYTLGSSTNPGSTVAASLITTLYRKSYIIMFGDLTKYNATDTNVSDGIMEGVFTVVQTAASRILEGWAQALKPQSQTKMPEFDFNENERYQIAMCKGYNFRFTSREDPDLDEVGDAVD